MNDDPKPLPDDFGMTIPNLRLPKQNQQGGEGDLPTTNLRDMPPAKSQPPAQPPMDDYGMTTPNLRMPNQQQPPPQSSPYDLPTTNLRQPNKPPGEADFGLTMNNYNPKQSSGSGAGATEDEFASTVSYIPYPTKPQAQPQRENVRVDMPQAVLPPPAQPVQQKRKGGVPWWAWLAVGGLMFFMLLGIGGVAAYFILFPDTGFTLVLKGAPAGSTVFIDNQRRGVTSADGSTRILGIEADKRRAVKVTKEGCSDFNTTVEGKNGSTEELITQMKCEGTAITQKSGCLAECKDDPRVCAAECSAQDALEKALTVDELVAAMNLQIINFESNSFIIPPARKRFLERAAERFKQLKGNPVVEIGGHTDNVGNVGANAKLSENRANAVLTILANNGVNIKALKTRGYGSTKPKTGNDSEDGRFQNRRIEYTVLSR